MGVNMPARTVVFDSIKKYDGTNFRILYPSEYVQMAGRAGRRGHDTAGMVIVMCRTLVPHFNELQNMMCGQAQNLESKFKVTYSMVLNLRRLNESVTVEAMMRRSFKESPVVKNQNNYKIQLQKLENELSKLPPLTDLQKNLYDFYRLAVEYLEYLKYLKSYFYDTQKKAIRCLTIGRVLLISYENHYNKLGILLGTVKNKGSKQYRVLVLKSSDTANSVEETSLKKKSEKAKKSDKWYDIVALTKKEIFVPVGIPSDEVLTIAAWNIMEITNCEIKVDHIMILGNWEGRQIPRFR